MRSPAIVFLSLFAPAAASAQTGATCRPNPHLARALESYRNVDYSGAAGVLQRAIEYYGNCRDDLAEIYRLKGTIDAIHGERERCQRDFEIFLALRPSFTPGSKEPGKIQSCLELALATPPEKREIHLEVQLAAKVEPKTPVPVRIEVRDPLRLVAEVQVLFRREGLKVYTVLEARADDRLSVVIPSLALPADGGYAVEYFVRAVDRWGGTLAEVGSAKAPLRFWVGP